MKKIKISLAALTLVLAIAGTTTVNATKTNQEALPCWQIDPGNDLCTNNSLTECCEDDDHNIKNERAKPH